MISVGLRLSPITCLFCPSWKAHNWWRRYNQKPKRKGKKEKKRKAKKRKKSTFSPLPPKMTGWSWQPNPSGLSYLLKAQLMSKEPSDSLLRAKPNSSIATRNFHIKFPCVFPPHYFLTLLPTLPSPHPHPHPTPFFSKEREILPAPKTK